MSLQSEIAFTRNRQLITLGHAVAARTVGLWRQVPLRDLDAGWNAVAPLMQQQIASAQVLAARESATYLDAIDASYGLKPKKAALIPLAFTNVMGDGREVAPALFGAVTSTKELIGAGVAPARAFESGASFIAIVAQAALHDMARNADRVLGAGRGYTRYVRVVNGSACSRCAILSGIYSGPDAFKRHVGCQCGTVMLSDDHKVPQGLYSSPEEHFASLSRAEQDRVYTKAGAEAIRRGADPVKVVNARRGAYGIGYSGHEKRFAIQVSPNRLQKITIGVRSDGKPLQVYATTEGTTARGQFFKSERDRVAGVTKQGRYTRTNTLRLMPEQIAVMAGGNNARWVELLQKYGYLQ